MKFIISFKNCKLFNVCNTIINMEKKQFLRKKKHFVLKIAFLYDVFESMAFSYTSKDKITEKYLSSSS